MKFFDNIIQKFLIDPLFTEIRDGVELSGYDSKQKYLQDKIDILEHNRDQLISMAKKIEILTDKLALNKNDLHFSEQKYKDLVEHSKDIIFLLNEDCSFSYVSPALLDICGYDPEDLIGKHLPKDWISKKDYKNLTHKLQLLSSRELDYIVFESEFKCKDEKIIYIELTAFSIISNILKGIQGIVRDTTEQKNYERKILDNEIFLNSIINNIPIPVFFKDNNGYYNLTNKAFEDFVGKSKEELLKCTPYDITEEKFAQIYHKVDMELLQGLKYKKFTTQFQHIYGQLSDIIVHRASLCNTEGDFIGSIGAIQDITELKQIELALRESEEKYRTLVENLPIPIYRVTPGPIGKFIHVNEALCKLFSLSKEELLETKICNFYKDPDRRKDFSDTLIEKGCVTNFEEELVLPNGSMVNVVISARAIQDNDQVYFDCSLLDVTRECRIRQRYKHLFDNMLDAVAIYKVENDQFIFVDINQTGENWDNIKKEDIIGREVSEVFPGVEQFGLLPVLQKVWETGIPEKLETSLYDDGKYCGWRENIVYKLPHQEIVAIYSDETERMTALLKLQKNNQILESILESQTDCIARCDLNRKILYANKAYLRFFCGTEEMSNDCRCLQDFLNSVYPEDLQKVEKTMEQLLRIIPHHQTLDCRALDHKGNVKFFHWEAYGILDDKGNVIEIQGIGRDILDQVRKRIK